MNLPRLAILGEYRSNNSSHVATDDAIVHSLAAADIEVQSQWVPTETIDDALFDRYAGIWVAPGSPYADMEKTLAAIRRAREGGIPCLGTCGGFQHMVIEYARNVLGFTDAQHAEYDPNASRLFITRLACSLVGREMQLSFAPDSGIARICGTTTAKEQYYCNFGVAPEAVALLQTGPLRVVAADAEGEVRAIELPGHPFFVGTLFIPQMLSRAGRPHPLVTEFLRAVARTGE